MKKTAALLLIISLLIAVAACHPTEVDALHYKGGVKALSVVDDYLDFKISNDDAYELMDSIYGTLDSASDDKYAYNSIVDLYVSILNLQLATSNADDMLDTRNNLADLLSRKQVS